MPNQPSKLQLRGAAAMFVPEDWRTAPTLTWIGGTVSRGYETVSKGTMTEEAGERINEELRRLANTSGSPRPWWTFWSSWPTRSGRSVCLCSSSNLFVRQRASFCIIYGRSRFRPQQSKVRGTVQDSAAQQHSVQYRLTSSFTDIFIQHKQADC